MFWIEIGFLFANLTFFLIFDVEVELLCRIKLQHVI